MTGDILNIFQTTITWTIFFTPKPQRRDNPHFSHSNKCKSTPHPTSGRIHLRANEQGGFMTIEKPPTSLTHSSTTHVLNLVYIFSHKRYPPVVYCQDKTYHWPWFSACSKSVANTGQARDTSHTHTTRTRLTTPFKTCYSSPSSDWHTAASSYIKPDRPRPLLRNIAHFSGREWPWR